MTLRISLLIAVLTAATCTAAFGVGRSTIDPNAIPRTRTPSTNQAVDLLDFKVTYEARAARLHDVISELAKRSGATIYCGKDDSDWRVRDIPVTVAARNIALGKLLKYLASCTHTLFKSSKTSAGTVYRIVSNPDTAARLAEYEKALGEYTATRNAWSWDVASRLKDIPACDFTGSDDVACDQAESALIASIDPGTRDRILAGEAVKVSPRTDSPEVRDAVLGICRASHTSLLSSLMAEPGATTDALIENPAMVKPPDQDLQDSEIGISIGGSGPQMVIRAIVKHTDSQGHLGILSNETCASIVSLAEKTVDNNKKRFDLPKKPTQPEKPKSDPPGPGFRPLDSDTPGVPEKIALDFAPGSKIAWPADLLLACAKVTGMTLVCEDFQTVPDNLSDSKRYQNTQTARSEVLQTRSFVWTIDPKDKILLGSDVQWPDMHKSLLPEQLVDSLAAKANGDGVELDDLLPMVDYPAEAARNNLRGRPFGNLRYGIRLTKLSRPVWAFYRSLSDARKAEVNSKNGLVLSQFNSGPLMQAARDYIKRQLLWETSDCCPQIIDPAVAPTLRLRMATYKGVMPGGGSTIVVNPGATDPGQGCALILEGKDGDKPVSLTFSDFVNVKLPYFSPERNKELAHPAEAVPK